MGTILLVIQVIIALALILFVLVQRSDGDGMSGLGGGAAGGSGIISARGKANFMTRSTAILAAAFMLNSLLMAIVSSQNSSRSLVDRIEVQANGEPMTEEEAEKALSAPLGDEAAKKPEAVKKDKIEAPAEKAIDKTKEAVKEPVKQLEKSVPKATETPASKDK